jgi:hypothetical protein
VRGEVNGNRGEEEAGRKTGVSQQHAPRRTFLSRVLGPERRSPGGNPEVGVKRISGNAGSVQVQARLEDICLRTVNEFGLYETATAQCIIIRVDARC